jgi:hypothetical protein
MYAGTNIFRVLRVTEFDTIGVINSTKANVIIWDEMLSSGMKCYHLGLNFLIGDEM